MAGNPSPTNKIKKGEARNPSGRSSLSLEGDKIRTMKYYEFMHLLHRCSFMTAKEITDWVAREESTMFERMFGGLVIKAGLGDLQALEILTNRLFGKVKEMRENINVNYETTVSGEVAPVFQVEMTDQGRFVTQRPRLVVDGDEYTRNAIKDSIKHAIAQTMGKQQKTIDVK